MSSIYVFIYKKLYVYLKNINLKKCNLVKMNRVRQFVYSNEYDFLYKINMKF